MTDSRDYVLACYRYIEMNPVRAGMVPQAAHYVWSSHRANAGHRADVSLSPHPEYLGLASDTDARNRAYRSLFEGDLSSSTLREIRQATNSGYPLAGEDLRARVAQMGRRIEPGRAGRPPKQEEIGL
jgi:putative transposase